jgi:hypothetical protein
LAQKGIGDSEGVARQTTKPKLITLEARVLEVKTGPCETATGKSPVGTHVFIRSGKKKLNVHLGPADAMESVAKELSRGKEVKVEAFRTKAMDKGHYVARSITFDGRKVQLRDETLRPVWAGPGGGWRGGGSLAGRPRWGRGRGLGRQGWGPRGVRSGRYGGCW